MMYNIFKMRDEIETARFAKTISAKDINGPFILYHRRQFSMNFRCTTVRLGIREDRIRSASAAYLDCL